VETDETRAAVRDLYGAYQQRDFERVAAYLDDDIEWVIYAPRRLFSFSGPRKGKRAVLEALGGIAKDYIIEAYVPKVMIADGDRAAVLSDVVFEQRGSGRRLNFRIANFLRWRSGRVVEFQEFIDTFDVVEQAFGQHINLS
jgi:ketosteroid isomerase-like protein